MEFKFNVFPSFFCLSLQGLTVSVINLINGAKTMVTWPFLLPFADFARCQQPYSRLKYQTKKPFSWILVFTKAIDFKIHLSLTCKLNTSRHIHFNTRISLPATHQGSVKSSPKAKHLGCFERTLKNLPPLKVINHDTTANVINSGVFRRTYKTRN